MKKRILTLAILCAAFAACEGRVPTSADITPADTLVLSGEPVQLTAEVRDQDNELMADAMGTWSVVSGPVEVSGAGLATGTAYGVGKIQFVIEDLVAEATVRVNPKLDLKAEMAYINQAVQNPEDLIPLIPGRAGLLRLFVAVETRHFYRTPPAVRVEVGTLDTTVSQVGPGIRKAVDESDLQHSYNVVIPGDLTTGSSVDLRVTYDPEDKIEGITGEEVLTFEVADLPRFDLMVVPTVSSKHPRPAITDWAKDGLTFDHSKMWAVKKLLPVSAETGQLTVHEVLNVDYEINTFNGWVRWLNHMNTLRRDEGRLDYYLGVMKHAGGAIRGIAYRGYPAVVAIDNPTTMSHELGHGMSLAHAPCDVPGDPDFPHEDGEIGQWGIDLDGLTLIPPDWKDHMGYCRENDWVSDYFFNKSLEYRDFFNKSLEYRDRTNRREGFSEPVLVLSGDITGKRFEPALALDAVPDAPAPNGTHLLTGFDEAGAVAFSHRFHPLEVLDGEVGHLMFNVAVPYDMTRSGELERVTLTGPSIRMSLLPDSHPRLVMERRNGQVVSITTDHKGPVPLGALSSTGIPQKNTN